MSNIKVSVIIATYNHDKYIGRCLRSLLDQSLANSDYEIIVVDDGSTDNTEYALDLFLSPKDSMLKIIRNESNRGLPYSINKGIKKANGKYIVRVDSDDFVNFNFLQFLSFYLETNETTNAVSCDYYLVNDGEEVITKKNCLDEPIACGILFRKDNLFKIGLYDESFRCNEDKDLRIRFLNKYTIDRLAIPLYRYRRHSKNITNNTENMDKYKDKLLRKHIDIDPKMNR